MFAVIWDDTAADEVRLLRLARTEEKAYELMGEITIPRHARMSQEDIEEAKEDDPDFVPPRLRVIDLMNDEAASQAIDDVNSYLENTEEDAFDY